MEFVKDQFRHCKAILALGASRSLLEQAGIPLDGADTGLVLGQAKGAGAAIEAFIGAVAMHRHFGRESDPPLV